MDAPVKRKHSAEQHLDAAGVTYVREGKRLLVAGRVHFWPEHGRWIDQNTADQGRGLNALVAHVRRTS